jgi:hypothetical protein
LKFNLHPCEWPRTLTCSMQFRKQEEIFYPLMVMKKSVLCTTINFIWSSFKWGIFSEYPSLISCGNLHKDSNSIRRICFAAIKMYEIKLEFSYILTV